jgi:beta-glucosidase
MLLSTIVPSQDPAHACRRQDPPLYPFAHGLSYTTFSASDLSVVVHPQNGAGAPNNSNGQNALVFQPYDVLAVHLKISNTGSVPGSWPVLLFVADKSCIVPPTPPMLRGFQKVYLQPGESVTVAFKVMLWPWTQWLQ